MRLAFKLVFAFLLANILLAAVWGYLSINREIRIFEGDARSRAEALGPPLEILVINAWRSGGYSEVQNVVRRVSRRDSDQMHVRWVWFDAQAGSDDAPLVATELLTTTVVTQHVVIEQPAPEGGELFDIYWPVPLPSERRGGLEFTQLGRELEASKREIEFQTALVIGGMVLISGLLAAYLGVRMIGRPLRLLTEKTQRVAEGDLTGPIHLLSRDELAELAESLNQMCERLVESHGRILDETTARITAVEQLRHADRLKTVGRLAAGIAHELGTPLNVVAGRASLIQSGRLSPEEINVSASAIKTEADRMTRIIRQLLDFARGGKPRTAPVDLNTVVNRTLDLLRQLAESRRVRFAFTPADSQPVASVDADQIQQVLTNLVMNAIQSMPGGGCVEIAVAKERITPPESQPPQAGDYYRIEVHDAGSGISPENLEHLFEPFFTTKEVGEGTGLGLSIAYGIVREHGGWIDVTSQPGQGSCFRVHLPAGVKS